MASQIGRRGRLATLRKVLGRCHGEHLHVRGETYRDHVFLEPLADAYGGVEAASDDVAQTIVDHDIEHDLRVHPIKATDSRCNDFLRRHAHGVNAQCSRGPARRGHRVGDGSVHLRDHRGDSLVKARSGCRRRNAARSAIEQPHAEATFELPDDLAQGGTRQAEMVGGACEARALDHGDEGPELGKLGASHCVLLSK